MIHKVLPRTRIGGGFPENLKADYKAALPCDSESDVRTFTPAGLTGKPFDKTGTYVWMDLGLKGAQDYYICIGKSEIRRGFSHFHFEEADNILLNCPSRPACITGYKRVRDKLEAYAKEQGIALSFSGEPVLAGEMSLNSVYIPSRFYIEDFDREYRNKVETGVGKGYTYVLSSQIVQDLLKKVPKSTHVFFYVDNFDAKQDDLRRMMELDGPNRREMIRRSSEVATKLGATFIPSYNHCDGCIPASFVGDACEISASNKVTIYNARVCGDLDTIQASFAVPHGGDRR